MGRGKRGKRDCGVDCTRKGGEQGAGVRKRGQRGGGGWRTGDNLPSHHQLRYIWEHRRVYLLRTSRNTTVCPTHTQHTNFIAFPATQPNASVPLTQSTKLRNVTNGLSELHPGAIQTDKEPRQWHASQRHTVCDVVDPYMHIFQMVSPQGLETVIIIQIHIGAYGHLAEWLYRLAQTF